MAFGEDLDELVEKTGGLLGKFETWERVRLSNIANVVNGYAFKSKYFSRDDGEPLIRIRDILSGETGTLYNGPRIDGYDVKAGDLLIGMDGDFNAARWQGRNALLNQRVCRIDIKSNHYHPRLLSYALPGYLNKINEHTSAVTVKHLSSRTIQNIPLPLPPLAEQSRIVDKIDELFSSIEAGERAIARARTALTRYRKAVLKAAVTGELTADWRAQNPPSETADALLTRILKARYTAWEKAELEKLDAKGKARPKTDKELAKFRAKYKTPVEPLEEFQLKFPKGWRQASVERLTSAVRVISYGVLQPGDNLPEGTKLVRVCDVKNSRINQEKLKIIDPSIAEKYQRTFLEGGELLVTLVGSVGRTAIVPKSLQGANVARAVGVLPISDIIQARWVELALIEEKSNQNLIGSSREVARKTLNLEQLRSFPIPLPPLNEQAEIVSRVEEALSKADKVEATLDAQARQAKALKQAVLKTAFEGNLVPQNPNDEPASELLKQIKAAS